MRLVQLCGQAYNKTLSASKESISLCSQMEMHSETPKEFIFSGPLDKECLRRKNEIQGQRSLPTTARALATTWEEAAVTSRSQQKHLISNNFSKSLDSVAEKMFSEKRIIFRKCLHSFCTLASLGLTGQWSEMGRHTSCRITG